MTGGRVRPRSFLSAFVARPASLAGAALCVAVASLAPLPFGSTSAPWVAGLVISFALALPLCAAAAPLHLRAALAVLLLAVVAVALFAVVQERVPALVGPGAGIWGEVAPHLGIPDETRIAVSAGRSPPALGGPLLAALGIGCGLVLGRSRRLAGAVLRALAAAGTLYAAAAIAWHLHSPDHVLWWRKSAHANDLTATFTNRNTAAIFIGFTLLILATRIASILAELSARERRRASGRAQTRALRRLAAMFLAASLCCTAIVLTNSRAGLVLTLAAAGLAILLRLRGRARSMGTGWWAVGGLFALPVALAMVLETRLGESLGDGGRLATYRATLHMIASSPWFGVGLGSFGTAFPQWRLPEAPMWGTWDRAHNTLLEVAAEMGVPAALALALAWGAALVLVTRSALRRPDLTTVAPLAIMFLGLGHSMVDFSIQIPGCAAFFHLCAGLGIGRALDRSWRRRHPFPAPAETAAPAP